MPSIDNSFVMNHTCLRIKDPKVSVPFYTENFGMKLVATLPFPDKKFTLYMLSYDGENTADDLIWSSREGVLELCHNHGVEDDESYSLNNGNGTEFRGFGHICVSVDNIEVAEAQLLSKGVKFQKKLSDGRQKNIAFALDPNGYWIELIEHGQSKAADKTDAATYKLNHTMIRVKDPKKSLDFYRNVLGMKLFSTSVHEGAKFTLYFLGYHHDPSFKEGTLTREEQSKKQGVIELTHNWGTETDNEFSYHNGNSTENGAKQGYGHTCVSCGNPDKFCQEINDEFGESNIDWSVQFNKGALKGLAFIRDPDGYSIEIINSVFNK